MGSYHTGTSPPSSTPSSTLTPAPDPPGAPRAADAPGKPGAPDTAGSAEPPAGAGPSEPPAAPAARGGRYRRSRPVAGRKSRSGSSAYTRASIAQPSMRTSSWVKGSGSPAAIRIIHSTRSSPVTASVTGCSTWSRVFISRK